MAAVAPAADQATDLLQKLSLEPKTKTHDAPEVTKKNTVLPAHERSMTPVLQNIDSNMCYFPPNGYTSPYYFGGYDTLNDWEDYPRYINADGVEMPPPGVYGDMYHPGYGYASYGPYPSPGSPVPTLGHDGQLYGPQHYQYPTPYYQPPSPASAPYTPNQPPKSKGEVVSTSAAPDQPPISLDAAKVNANGVANGTANANNAAVPPKPSQQNSTLASNGYGGALPNGLPSSGYQDPRFSFDGMRSPVPWFDGPVYPDSQHRLTTSNAVSSTGSHVNSTSGRSQNLRPLPHLMGMHNPRPTSGMGPATPGLMNRMYPNNRMYNAYSTGLGFRPNFYDSRANGRWGVVDNKYKPRGRGNGFYGYANENLDGLSELNRGPRANRYKNQKGFGPNVTIAVKGQNLPTNGNAEETSVVPDKDQYNKADFPVDYSDAKFFIIKSYSEDDIHKSVKYNVWASTPNGNKKLHDAYQEAQGKAPIYLFFSVNTSGQFVGVAEMVSPVDFNKTVDYWQQDKWTGCFSVKWHIVKDVPNNILRQITLENNDNKPVTNSRDTQEVKLEQGLQMLKLFKEHVSKTSILDDFGFYETRQKVMQEKRAKQQQLHKQVADGKPVDAVDEKDKDAASGKPRLQKPLEAVTVLKKETNAVGLGERKPSEGNGSTPVVAADVSKVAKAATEKRVVANGVTVVANGGC